MERSKVTDYMIKYLEETDISPEQVSNETGIPIEKLRRDYTVSLASDEFLELCVYLQIRPEMVRDALNGMLQ